MTVTFTLLVLALVCFLVEVVASAVGRGTRVSLIALGLALWVAASLFGHG